MSRAVARFVLLVAMLPGDCFAGPPGQPSTRMAFVDEVADGLRQYRKETDTNKRVRWLEKLALTRDPRVALLLGAEWEACGKSVDGVIQLSQEGLTSYGLLSRYYLPPAFDGPEWTTERTTDAKGVHHTSVTSS